MPVTWSLKQWLATHHGLTKAKQIRDTIQNRTGQEIPLQSINILLKKQPKTLDTLILQTVCDVFRCQLKHFCAMRPSPLPPLNRTPINIQHLVQPCAIGPNETLRSFIARVQMAGIRQALLMSGDNFCHASRLLGSDRGYLWCLYYRRPKKTTHTRNSPQKQSRAKAILLPAAIFTIRPNEDFHSFTRRIQVAAILGAIKTEGNHSRAALRLGYERTSFVRLRSRLLDADINFQAPENRKLQLQARLQPCAIASHETLYSFVARVKLAAIEEALSITLTYGKAARRLDYRRTSLNHLHTRLKRNTTLNHNAAKRTRRILSQPVLLPRAVFTIQKDEHLESFIRRIQLAAIIQTTRLEGNHTQAALRLGYRRSSLVHLISKLKGAHSGD